MKISNQQTSQILAQYAQQAKKVSHGPTADRTGKTQPAGKQDQLVLSERAKEIQLAMKAAQAAPDIREEKVQALKVQIEQGTYQVSASALAKAMLEKNPNE